MRIINFGAGPAKVPEEVMVEIQRDFLHYGNTGISIVEMSHRSTDYAKINDITQDSLRSLLKIPDNYKILFLQGGGTGLFAAIPLNLLRNEGTADYVVTGSWSSKAAEEAAKYGKINLVLPTYKQHIDIPDQNTWNLNPNASYIYYCANETINGIEFPFIPVSDGVPIVADMSSNFLSRLFDVSKFGVIFAGAQKNIGIAGVTVVIVREDLLGNPSPQCPSVLDFTKIAKFNSILNTPPCFSIYVMGKVFEWIIKKGGVQSMELLARQKSDLIYDAIECSEGFYKCFVEKQFRSKMNVTFTILKPHLEEQFLKDSKEKGMIQLKGHRSVGGLRVSLYNAITIEEANVLRTFMLDFMKKYRKEVSNI